MNEKIICKSKIDVVSSLVVKSLLLIPAGLIIGAFATGEPFDFTWAPGWILLVGIATAVPVGVLVFALSSCEMVITDKRVYGKSAFGQSVDLPLDMISATTSGILKSVGVSTASGRITFWLLENQRELHSSITTLLLKRQQKKDSESPTASISVADELQKFKKLLDKGIITQEEFETKKKELLGL